VSLPLASTSGGSIALWSIIYFVLLLTLGLISLRKGHWVMFIIGIFLPLFWFIGALLPRKRS
jgi:putative copper export protein